MAARRFRQQRSTPDDDRVRDVCPKAVCVRAPRVGGRPRGPGGMAPTDHRQPWLGVRPNAHVENWGALRERLEFGFRFDKRRWSYLLAFGVAVPLLTYNAIKDDLVRGGGAPFRHATAPLAAERRRMGHAVRRGTKLATNLRNERLVRGAGREGAARVVRRRARLRSAYGHHLGNAVAHARWGRVALEGAAARQAKTWLATCKASFCGRTPPPIPVSSHLPSAY